MTSPTIKVAEIFGPTIQGEGPNAGAPTVFVRTGGCDYRCTWCDSDHAVSAVFKNSWRSMTPYEICEQVNRLAISQGALVTISGGNPALYDLGQLIASLHGSGHRVAIETQGSIVKPWMLYLDSLVISPKPPSSGEHTTTEQVMRCLRAGPGHAKSALKFVVAGDPDYDYARSMADCFPDVPLFLQPCNEFREDDSEFADRLRADAFRGLCERVAEDRLWRARVLPQLHVYAWGTRNGV